MLVAEDQEVARDALCALVGATPDLLLVGRARDGREAVDAAVRLRPDVVLVDIRMPVLDGVEATRLIRARVPQARVVVLTTFDLDEYVDRALRAGACGFVLKSAPVQDVLRALRAARAGDSVLSPEVARRVVAGYAARPGGPTPFDALAERERQVVAGVVRGLSNEEVAAELFLSLATVKTYLSRVFDKLGVRDRTQLVVLAYRTGFAGQESTFG
ncbi:two component transcriptional regulator, LuxR family [Actinosynnema pretiosum]|nr:two component transcriptional regulator, LuxR family [Actinosynnema pretiosum]